MCEVTASVAQSDSLNPAATAPSSRDATKSQAAPNQLEILTFGERTTADAISAKHAQRRGSKATLLYEHLLTPKPLPDTDAYLPFYGMAYDLKVFGLSEAQANNLREDEMHELGKDHTCKAEFESVPRTEGMKRTVRLFKHRYSDWPDFYFMVRMVDETSPSKIAEVIAWFWAFTPMQVESKVRDYQRQYQKHFGSLTTTNHAQA